MKIQSGYLLILILVMTELFFSCRKEKISPEENDMTNFSSEKISATPIYKGVYVNDFDTILGDSMKEWRLLDWCQRMHFNSISLYDLTTIFSISSNTPKLVNFIRKAKTQFGIKNVNAVRGSAASFTGSTSTYNNSRTDTIERFNWANLELEWWNNACTFPYYSTQMQQIKTWCNQQNPKMKNEEYIGWFQNPTGQDSIMAAAIVTKSARVMVHDYQTTPSFGYMQSRLDWLGRAAKAQGKTFNVIVIFSAEPSFSANYFITHSFDDAYNLIKTQHNASTFAGKNNIKIIGYQIFDQSYARLVKP